MGFLQKSKDFDYFKAFSEIAQQSLSAAQYLDKSLNEFSYENFYARIDEMHNIENRADTIKHEIITRLSHEFITPIEREDIVELSQAFDTVVDAIDDVMRRIYMFNIKNIRPEALQFSKVIVQGCETLNKLAVEFRNFKKSETLKHLIIEANTYENCGDDLHLQSLHKMFSQETDAMSVLSWKSIIDALEECCDAIEDVADIIESIIMKNT